MKKNPGWLVCEDPGCSNRTRRIPLRGIRGFPVCNVCSKGVVMREYTESQLYRCVVGACVFMIMFLCVDNVCSHRCVVVACVSMCG